MDNFTTILLSTVLSGAFATFVTLWWQRRNQIKQEKVRIFTILMSKRYDPTAEECVDALNMVDVVFYKNDNVRKAWRNFKNATEMPESDAKIQAIIDKRLKMLEVMAESIGYKRIKWDDINQYYYPVGLSDRKRDEEVLRRVQIDASLAQLKNQQEHTDSSQVDPQEDFKNQMLIRTLEDPDRLLKFFEVAEKAQKFNKGGKVHK